MRPLQLPVGESVAVVDVETAEDRVIEIGIVRFDAGQPTRVFSSVVNPGVGGVRCPIRRATHIHGIPQDVTRVAPTFAELVPVLVSTLAGARLVAHNAVPVEARLLEHEFGRLGLRFDLPWTCTLAMARQVWPGLRSHSLSALCRTLGVCEGGHRALADAWATAAVFARLLEAGA